MGEGGFAQFVETERAWRVVFRGRARHSLAEARSGRKSKRYVVLWLRQRLAFRVALRGLS